MIEQFRRPRSAASVILAAALAGCVHAPLGAPGPANADSLAVRRDVGYLASDALQGRQTGTPGNDTAAAYIARRYAALGLRPLSAGYEQPFVAHSIAAAHAGQPADFSTQNVMALLPGRDPALRGEYIVIGAHFDHLGRSTDGALDPDDHEAVRKGADDNASGTAAVLELARLLSRNPPRRSVIFANFSGEELGLLGSAHWVEHSPVPLDSIVAMLNFDMVGRLRNDTLLVLGASTATEFRAILDSATASNGGGMHLVTPPGDGFGPSDQSSFFGKNIPVLHFFTNLHEDYHRASDVAAKINSAGEAKVIDLAARVAQNIADRPGRPTLVKTASAPPAEPTRGSDAYLGSVPDMAGSDVQGVRLSGVRAGSPAAQAGLLAGDVIVEFGGTPVKDLYSYTDALYAHQPGEAVKIVVLRGGQRVEVTATLGRRGG